MPKTVDALEARRRFGEILNQARYGKQSIIVKRAGKPMAVIMPVEIYEALTSVPDEEIEIYTPSRIKEFLAADTKP
jgi:prevent-host-death family protein